MQVYHRIYIEGGSSGCAMAVTPLVKFRFLNGSERVRATRFLLAGCVWASAGLAALSWPLLPPEPTEGSAQLARPEQRFPLLSLAQRAEIDVAFRTPGPQSIDVPRTERLLRSWDAERIGPSVREESVILPSQAGPVEALANSKSVSAVTVSPATLHSASTKGPPARRQQAESGSRRDGDLQPVAPTRPTDASHDAGTGLADDGPLIVASQSDAKPAFLSISPVELIGQDTATPLTALPAQSTMRIAPTDVMPAGQGHSIELLVQSHVFSPDVPEVTHISLSTLEPGLLDGSSGIRPTEDKTQQALLPASPESVNHEAGRFTVAPMEMAVHSAEPEALMPATEAAPAERFAESRPVRPMEPKTAHVSPLPAAQSSHSSAEGAIQRKVDIEQVAESGEQLHGPSWRSGGNMTLAAKVEAMQVPPFALAEQELAALRTEAPVEMTVRLGGESVGKVAFRMAEKRTIEIQLAGLLDLIADRLAPEEFARLRASAAANSFVPMHRLRAIGLTLRYDPVYDELLISA